MQTDILGREIKVRDIVVYSSSSYVNVCTGVVTKINPKTIQIDGSGAHFASSLMIVTEQYGCSGKQSIADTMIHNNAGRFDDTPPVIRAASQKWKYGIFMRFDTTDMYITDINQCSVHIVKLASNTDSEMHSSYRSWVKQHPYFSNQNFFYSVSQRHSPKMLQSSVTHRYDLPLTVIKNLGLKDFINSSLSYTDFIEIVKGRQFNLDGFDPMKARLKYR